MFSLLEVLLCRLYLRSERQGIISGRAHKLLPRSDLRSSRLSRGRIFRAIAQEVENFTVYTFF